MRPKKTGTYQAAALLVVSGLVAAHQSAVAQNESISMHEEPRHRLVFEHDQFNLVDLSIPVGDTSLYHLHDFPTFWVVLNDARIESQTLGEEWVRQPEERPLRPVGTLVSIDNVTRPPHRVRNVDKDTLHLFAVVHKGFGADVSEDVPEEGIEFDDRWVRARRFKLAGTSSSSMLHSDWPSVVVQATPGQTDVPVGEYSTGIKTVVGGWSWHEGGRPFRLRNLGLNEVELILIEVKI